MKNFDISIYGNLIVDTVYETHDFKESFSNKCNRKYTSLGGAANIVDSLHLIDESLKLSLDAQIGHDSDGEYCLKWLEAEKTSGVDLKYKITKTSHPTSHALIISDLEKIKEVALFSGVLVLRSKTLISEILFGITLCMSMLSHILRKKT